MRALQLCRRPASAAPQLVVRGGFFDAACSFSRRFAAAEVAATATAAAAAPSDADVIDYNEEGQFIDNSNSGDDSTAGAIKAPRKPLEVTLLKYIYSANTGAPDTRLMLPQGKHSVERIQRMMDVENKEDLMKALDGASLSTEDDCTRYINLVVAYIRHEKALEQQEDSPLPTMREHAAHKRASEAAFCLNFEEKSALLRKACALAEQRRIPLVVASRLLRHRWPAELRASGGPTTQRYVMELLQPWIAEQLQAETLPPRVARALLSNCAAALNSQMQLARKPRSGHGSSTRVPTRDGEQEKKLSSFIGSLAAVAVKDIQSPSQAEALISVMWDVYSTGCVAPASFWEEMVRRVVQFNAALDSQLAEAESTGVSDSSTSKRKERPLSRQAGHFFSTLTTRQLYRFLLVLKLSKWAGDTTLLHQLADQALRNVAFELEATRSSTVSKAVEASNDSSGSSSNEEAASAVAAAKAPITAFSPAFTGAAASPAKTTALSPQQNALKSKRDIARRIRRVADMRPHEFLELLSLAADLRVPFGVSATRVSEELLTPFVPHLSTKDLLTLLQIVRVTQSQSVGLLRAVMCRLIEGGPSVPYVLALSKTLIRTAATAPDLFATLDMDDFVDFFLDVCEAQFSLCRLSVLDTLGGLLYTLGRRYDEAAPPGQRIRAVVHLFCTHVDRLLQLQVATAANAERLLEVTVLLRMRPHPELYPGVQELLRTRAVVEEQEQARRAAVQAKKLGYIEAAAQQGGARTKSGDNDEVMSVAAIDELAAGRAPRWEDVSEQELPTLSRAALHVYGEVAYMFERMVVVRAKLNKEDFTIFERDVNKAGLYSLLKGVQLFHQGHLEAQVAYTTGSARAAAKQIPRVMPRWMEKTVNRIILRKISNSHITQASSDDAVLRLLGHVHCDAAKVDATITLIVESPLQVLKRQRALWLYIRELARRFGSEETKKTVDIYLSKSLF